LLETKKKGREKGGERERERDELSPQCTGARKAIPGHSTPDVLVIE
jgi:hypothetical protein